MITSQSREPSPWRRLLQLPAGVLGLVIAAALLPAPAQAATFPNPTPPVTLPSELDVAAPYQEGTLCLDYNQPGAVAFAKMLNATYGTRSYGILRHCAAEHGEGRALDWMIDATNSSQLALGNHITRWLAASDAQGRPGAMARRLGVNYMIWNRQIWKAWAPEKGWQQYYGVSPHTDHIHFSFNWDGALKRPSWYTGVAVTTPATGPVPPRTVITSTGYPLLVQGASGAEVAIAQKVIGVTADGSFGPVTAAALSTWQSGHGVPATQKLDEATWSRMVSLKLIPSRVMPVSQLETYGRPVEASFSLAGRGQGHGRGMSQYGAYGAALSGKTRDQILDFYYPGTTRVPTFGNPTTRVRLTAVGTTGTQVVHQAGLVVTDGSRTISLAETNADGTPRSRWRVIPDGTGLTLQWLESGTWRSRTGWTALATPLEFTNPSLFTVRIVMPDGTKRDYRRTIRTVRNGAAAMTVNVLPMDHYLRGVVPLEMSSSWSAAALQAQAVAARSYAAYQKARQPAGSLFDTCDSTSCQVYKGLRSHSSTGTVTTFEKTSTTDAVLATTGLAVFHGGAPALTEFSTANGGRTVASSLPYQVSKYDPYDAVPTGSPSRWTTTLPISAIEAAYPGKGPLLGLRITGRNGISTWGGRTTGITLVGSTGTTTVTADAFRSAMGLRSTWWTVTSAPRASSPAFPKDLDGDGRGDLMAVDPAGQLRMLSGNGASGFTSRSVASGWGDVRLVSNVGAWDADNRQDVVERDAGTLYYHPGNGKGGLLPRLRISSGWDSVNLVTGPGDLDSDGHTDLVSRTPSTGQLTLHRGNGKGGIAASAAISTGWNAFRVIAAAGDLNGDARPDLVAIRSSDSAMLLYRGNGAGGFASPTTVSGSWGGYSAVMAAGDVTGDGRDDLVGRRSSDGALVVLAGNDAGALSAGSVVTGTATWATWTRWTP